MNNNIIALAKKLRKNSTPAENLLWSHLRAEQLEGLKFRRQQLIGNYIIDFVCFEKKIVIEVDGGQHAIEKEKDSIRDEWLKGQGFKVLRFWNNEVLMNIESVLEVIRKVCLSPSLTPPIKGGEVKRYSIKGGEESSNPINGGGNERGFTLIELIMVIVLISIISSVAAMIILQGAKSYQKEVSYSDIHNQGRLAIERMAREIRLIRSATAADISTMTATNIVFNDVNGTNIQFIFAGNTISRSGNTLANNVQSLTFSYYQSDGVTVAGAAAQVWFIQIDLTTVNAGETLSLRLRVHPRNF